MLRRGAAPYSRTCTQAPVKTRQQAPHPATVPRFSARLASQKKRRFFEHRTRQPTSSFEIVAWKFPTKIPVAARDLEHQKRTRNEATPYSCLRHAPTMNQPRCAITFWCSQLIRLIRGVGCKAPRALGALRFDFCAAVLLIERLQTARSRALRRSLPIEPHSAVHVHLDFLSRACVQ